ncbi:hypothetical protein LTR08_002142 [Meristemomyces frigidus]|nr:hypothetical protein LTR08_002142 [Meristemomyces frigidus]
MATPSQRRGLPSGAAELDRRPPWERIGGFGRGAMLMGPAVVASPTPGPATGGPRRSRAYTNPPPPAKAAEQRPTPIYAFYPQPAHDPRRSRAYTNPPPPLPPTAGAAEQHPNPTYAFYPQPLPAQSHRGNSTAVSTYIGDSLARQRNPSIGSDSTDSSNSSRSSYHTAPDTTSTRRTCARITVDSAIVIDRLHATTAELGARSGARYHAREWAAVKAVLGRWEEMLSGRLEGRTFWIDELVGSMEGVVDEVCVACKASVTVMFWPKRSMASDGETEDGAEDIKINAISSRAEGDYFRLRLSEAVLGVGV